MCSVECQIDGIEFDMCQRMYQRCASGLGIGAAARHLLRRDQFRFGWLARLIDRRTNHIGCQIDSSGQPVGLQGMHAGHLVRRVPAEQAG